MHTFVISDLVVLRIHELRSSFFSVVVVKLFDKDIVKDIVNQLMYVVVHSQLVLLPSL